MIRDRPTRRHKRKKISMSWTLHPAAWPSLVRGERGAVQYSSNELTRKKKPDERTKSTAHLDGSVGDLRQHEHDVAHHVRVSAGIGHDLQ